MCATIVACFSNSSFIFMKYVRWQLWIARTSLHSGKCIKTLGSNILSSLFFRSAIPVWLPGTIFGLGPLGGLSSSFWVSTWIWQYGHPLMSSRSLHGQPWLLLLLHQVIMTILKSGCLTRWFAHDPGRDHAEGG